MKSPTIISGLIHRSLAAVRGRHLIVAQLVDCADGDRLVGGIVKEGREHLVTARTEVPLHGRERTSISYDEGYALSSWVRRAPRERDSVDSRRPDATSGSAYRPKGVARGDLLAVRVVVLTGCNEGIGRVLIAGLVVNGGTITRVLVGSSVAVAVGNVSVPVASAVGDGWSAVGVADGSRIASGGVAAGASLSLR